MQYDKGKHTICYHRYYLVWITKYRHAVLRGAVRERVSEVARQVCSEIGVTIIKGVLSTDHVHMFVSIPAHGTVGREVRGADATARASHSDPVRPRQPARGT